MHAPTSQESPSRKPEQPLISILIPVHNRLDRTRACLESLFLHADPAASLEILVIDDGSTDGTQAYLESLGSRVHPLSLASLRTFGEKMNLAAPLARGEFLCFLNNDTLVTRNWLGPMLAALQQDRRIAVVGNRHLTPGTGRINHAGMVFDARGYPVHLYRNQPADFPPALLSQEFQTLTAACWLLRKATFLELDGFDLQFKNGWEDVDFCLRARRQGGAIFYAAESVIYHHGLSTPGRTDHERTNADHFKAKWGRMIVSDVDDHYVIPPEPPPRKASEIEERYAEIETLRSRHPRTASLLRSVVRLATGAAKRLNRPSQKPSNEESLR